jgi:precorrin-4/cobalt-precorrin-4 C11-methyltransferase
VISFVGAGPGAADLLTLRAVDRLARAEVVLWAGSLVSADVLRHCRPSARRLDTSSMTLEDVTAVYAANPDAAIVRLHSGDPTIYSAIGEQIDWCMAHERSFEIVPGVSSLSAAAAAGGVELTRPGVSQTVVLGRIARRTVGSMGAGEDVGAHLAHGGVLALFLSAGDPDGMARTLLGESSAYVPTTPVLVAHRVSWPDEELIATTVGEVASVLRERDIRTTALVLVGDALAGGRLGSRSHVYDPAFATSFRPATRSGVATSSPPAAGPGPSAR